MATLEAVRRRNVRGDEETVLRDVECELKDDEDAVVIASEADVDVRPGDVLESDDLDGDKIVQGVRRRRGTEGFRTEILYREPKGQDEDA